MRSNNLCSRVLNVICSSYLLFICSVSLRFFLLSSNSATYCAEKLSHKYMQKLLSNPIAEIALDDALVLEPA